MSACSFAPTAWAMAFFAVVSPISFPVPSSSASIGVLALASLGRAVLGPSLATVHTLVLPRMRAMSLAIIYRFANLIGLRFAPLTVGALSDALQPELGADSLCYALVILCPGHLWAGWHVWRASQTIGPDLTALNIGHAADLSGSNENVRKTVATVTEV